MRILIADDDLLSRRVLDLTLTEWGHEVVVAHDGLEAWEVLQSDDAPKLAVLDWMMPGLEGAEVCRRVHLLERAEPTYLILLTAKKLTHDVVTGLDSGANDYVAKPFDRHELHSRIRVGERMVEVQRVLAQRVQELQQSLAEIKQLESCLPICSYCKRIRDDHNYWQVLESYFAARANVQFSHGICPDCFAVVAAEAER